LRLRQQLHLHAIGDKVEIGRFDFAAGVALDGDAEFVEFFGRVRISGRGRWRFRRAGRRLAIFLAWRPFALSVLLFLRGRLGVAHFSAGFRVRLAFVLASPGVQFTRAPLQSW